MSFYSSCYQSKNGEPKEVLSWEGVSRIPHWKIGEILEIFIRSMGYSSVIWYLYQRKPRNTSFESILAIWWWPKQLRREDKSEKLPIIWWPWTYGWSLWGYITLSKSINLMLSVSWCWLTWTFSNCNLPCIRVGDDHLIFQLISFVYTTCLSSKR